MEVHGNLINRLVEEQQVPEIRVDDDITMYYYSDRACYFVTRVVNQKDIFVKRYHICADHDKADGQGHQEWLYFKSANDMNKYLNNVFNKNYPTNLDDSEVEWIFRYNSWSEKYIDSEGKVRYRKLPKVNFGVRDYYYDWSF